MQNESKESCEMTLVVILNVVFATFVVVGILSLLAWAIATDKGNRAQTRSSSRLRASVKRFGTAGWSPSSQSVRTTSSLPSTRQT